MDMHQRRHGRSSAVLDCRLGGRRVLDFRKVRLLSRSQHRFMFALIPLRCFNEALRKLLSILLLALFGLPCASPLFASGRQAGTGLPACCRRNGQHHCMMSGQVALPDHAPQLRSAPEKCPYTSGFALMTQPHLLVGTAAQTISALPISHHAGMEPTGFIPRSRRDPSCPERGPPMIHLV